MTISPIAQSLSKARAALLGITENPTSVTTNVAQLICRLQLPSLLKISTATFGDYLTICLTMKLEDVPSCAAETTRSLN